MRKTLVLLGCTALAACGGGSGAGPTTVGGSALTSSNPNADPGPGTPVTFSTDTSSSNRGTSTGSDTTFLSGLTQPKTFNVIGGFQSLSIQPSNASTTTTVNNSDGTTTTIAYPGTETYKGDATTVQSPAGSITYDPRSGIFTLSIADSNASISNTFDYQDPAHRTDFLLEGVPNLNGFNYLAASTGDNETTTFFYQRPGESTDYVSLAGYARTAKPSGGVQTFERGAFVIGTPTVSSQVPTSGTGTYTGGMLATMVVEPISNARGVDTYFQWIAGSSNVNVNFGTGAVGLTLTGQVGPVFTDTRDNIPTITPAPASPPVSTPPAIAAGSTFTATGTATTSSIFSGGFSGQFQSANFTNNGTTTAVDFSRPSTANSTAGASSIDGSFYGPNAVNVGGSYRIVGGIPDQRVDILGAFTGAKH